MLEKRNMRSKGEGVKSLRKVAKPEPGVTTRLRCNSHVSDALSQAAGTGLGTLCEISH